MEDSLFSTDGKTDLVSLRCFIQRFNKPMHQGVVKFTDAPEILVVLFIGETPACSIGSTGKNFGESSLT
jgi:hypothetical protein